MKSGYKIEWTDNALSELRNTYKYLEDNWTEKEIRKLSKEIERILNLISNNPSLFPIYDGTVRKVVIKKLNSLYYQETHDNTIQILSFFSNRQNPNKRKI